MYGPTAAPSQPLGYVILPLPEEFFYHEQAVLPAKTGTIYKEALYRRSESKDSGVCSLKHALFYGHSVQEDLKTVD